MNEIVLLTTDGLGSVATLGMIILGHLWRKKQEEDLKKLRPLYVRRRSEMNR